jgi:aquaporin Z
MSFHKYLAEFLGALMLTMMVWLTLAGAVPVPTPFMAGLTLGLFVYMLGSVSGAHFNPAITIAMLSINKIKLRDAGYYIVSQILGAMAAMMIGTTFFHQQVMVGAADTPMIGIAEGMGAFILSFAVTGVTLHKVEKDVAGAVIGGALFLGILVASPMSNGVLNPAVAIGIGSFNMTYALGPIVGAIIGAFVASIVHGEKVRFG